jgi:hypothetical protein
MAMISDEAAQERKEEPTLKVFEDSKIEGRILEGPEKAGSV